MTTKKLKDLAVTVGAPVMAIAGVYTLAGVSAGQLSSFGAAVLAGIGIPLFHRFLATPLLKAANAEDGQLTEVTFNLVCNVGIGVAAALLTLPST